jgi:uncharacterized spore protein YtfJ
MNTKELMSEVTSQIQTNANVRVVFGEPIDRGNLTIIPVAKIVVNGGGGSGNGGAICIPTGKFNIAQAQFQPKTIHNTPANETKPAPPQSSTMQSSTVGIGLSIETHPLGYIEILNDHAKFKPIEDTTKTSMAGILLAAFSIFSVFRFMNSVLRIAKQKPKMIQEKGTKNEKSEYIRKCSSYKTPLISIGGQR